VFSDVVNIDIGAVAAAIVALCTVGNTALLIWHSRTLEHVKKDVNGAKLAAVEAAQKAGFVQGIISTTRPPLRGEFPHGESTGLSP